MRFNSVANFRRRLCQPRPAWCEIPASASPCCHQSRNRCREQGSDPSPGARKIHGSPWRGVPGAAAGGRLGRPVLAASRGQSQPCRWPPATGCSARQNPRPTIAPAESPRFGVPSHGRRQATLNLPRCAAGWGASLVADGVAAMIFVGHVIGLASVPFRATVNAD